MCEALRYILKGLCILDLLKLDAHLVGESFQNFVYVWSAISNKVTQTCSKR